jgi:hypothetical protein
MTCPTMRAMQSNVGRGLRGGHNSVRRRVSSSSFCLAPHPNKSWGGPHGFFEGQPPGSCNRPLSNRRPAPQSKTVEMGLSQQAGIGGGREGGGGQPPVRVVIRTTALRGRYFGAHVGRGSSFAAVLAWLHRQLGQQQVKRTVRPLGEPV